jgi:hypothetical protein
LDVESYERAVTAAAASAQAYESAKTIISVNGAGVQIGNGNGSALNQPGSKLENPSSASGDVLFGCVLAPLVGLFMFSLTPDPLAQGNRELFLDSNCDSCIQRQIQPKAQREVMSMPTPGVERFLKYTSEPAERLYGQTEQEITGNEVFNGHTVDVQSMLVLK